ncbi:hypothetical protein SAMN05192575_11081 [Nocardioides alpinus]|uniref:DUF5667 domain-containing protein n=1 Tax=Nocardioides alpinus TaxID=748909 RepID=A0A1I1AS93_9ACTN|nr:DUF5667 domain-containing protein [Nocardioides alpinus]PKH40341.1 hypothetical protein CXG46_13205 [Nocardioides alpinus]SFB40382.1 hypothetical protein SAMN05192575_11081 [Nocardioides alpinus]
MTAPFSARRRADEFEALLSRDPGTPLTERDAERFTALLDVVSDLRAIPEVAPRAEFVSSLRERLMVEADTALLQQPAAPSRLAMPVTTRARDRRVATLLGGAALVGATATMAVAAQTALPGESLYGVKRGIESAQVRFADDDTARGRALLAQADTRLTELEELTAGEGGNAMLIPDTLDAFTEQSGQGVRSLLSAYDRNGSDADVQRARDFTTESMDRLSALQGVVPESARDELLAAGRTLTDLDTEIGSACLSCSGGITTTPDFLLASVAAPDLLTGLDSDELSLEAAPVSGQDVTGIEIPKALQSPETLLPTASPTSTPSLAPEVPDPTTPTKGPGDQVKDATDGVKDGVKDGVDDVTDTTGDVVEGLDDATGGAIGGLTSGVDDATGGLIGEVTGTLDNLTGGTLDSATGGLLP